MQFRRYAGIALSLLHCYLASVSAVRANRAKRSVSKSYSAGLTIDLHSGGRRFALDSISRSVFSAPASAFRCPLACFRYIGRGSDTSFFWLCCNNRCASCRWPRTLKRQPGALSASPTCHAGIRLSELFSPGVPGHAGHVAGESSPGSNISLPIVISTYFPTGALRFRETAASASNAGSPWRDRKAGCFCKSPWRSGGSLCCMADCRLRKASSRLPSCASTQLERALSDGCAEIAWFLSVRRYHGGSPKTVPI